MAEHEIKLGGPNADCNPQCFRARGSMEECNCRCGGAHHGEFYHDQTVITEHIDVAEGVEA